MARHRSIDNSEDTASNVGYRSKSLITWLPLIAALLTAGSVCLHAIGAIAHRTFLNEMGVPPELFPKDVSWILINGFYAVFDRWNLLFKAYFDRPWQSILYGISVSVVLLAYWYLYRWNPEKIEWNRKLPLWTRAALRFVSLCIVIGGSLPVAVAFVLLLMFAIGAPGEFAGKAQAEKLRERYAKGCSSEVPCTYVRREEKLLLTGRVLDASQTHIAIYDPKAKLTHILETRGLELRRISPLHPQDPKR